MSLGSGTRPHTREHMSEGVLSTANQTAMAVSTIAAMSLNLGIPDGRLDNGVQPPTQGSMP